MSSQAWFVAASMSGTACAVLAVVVVVAGWRRRMAEVAILGAALFVVSVLATSSGVGGTGVGGGAPGARWAAMLALPAGVAAAVPLMAASTRLGRWAAARYPLWVTTWVAGSTGLAVLLVRVDAAPPLAVTIGGVAVGLVGAWLLVRRQVMLFRISRRSPALITAAAVAAIAVALVAVLAVTPGSAASWGLLAMENAGVLGAGVAVLVGYRHGRDVAAVLAPILAREPLAALELGLSPEVHAFVAALGRKDVTTRDHVVRTSALAMRVAIRAGLAPGSIRAVAVGALLHDIGKLVIPSDIINKPGALSDDEFVTIKTHPEQGERLLAGAPGLAAAAAHVRGHHERVDGRGYPDGLAGDDVTFEVGLISVADAWDAMTHTRQYREGMGTERAAAILRAGAGSQWRDDAVDLLLAEVEASEQVDLAALASLGHRELSAAEMAACVCDDAVEHAASPSTPSPSPSDGVPHDRVLRQVFDASPIAMVLVCPRGRLVALNRAMCEAVGRSANELVGTEAVEVFHPDEHAPTSVAMSNVLADGTIHHAEDQRLRAATGDVRIVDVSMCAVQEPPTGMCVLIQMVDVTDRHRRERELETLALIDALTGIANRRGFEYSAEVALATVTRQVDPPQLVFVDVDGLKEINDCFGHACGDAALRSAARIIASQARVGDVVGRLGGDEFAVLLPAAPPGTADELARRIQAVAASTALAASGRPLRLSIGTATTEPDEAPTLAALLAHADAAMYRTRDARTATP